MLERLREIFLENVRREAERLNLDYQDVAERAGLSRSGIYKIMRGDREPGFDNIERIANALGVQPAQLLLSPSERIEPTADQVLEIVTRALQLSAAPSLNPRIARVLSAISDPAVLESVELVLEATSPENQLKPRARGKSS